MPKFGAHILISELAASKRPDLLNSTNATRLGAIGPDLTLFLFDPITNKDVRKGFDIAIDVLSSIRKIKKELKDIEDYFKGPPTDLANWVTGGLSTDLTALLEVSVDTMLLAAKLGVAVGTSSLNIQNPMFKLVQNGQIDPKIFSDPRYYQSNFIIGTVDNFGFPYRYFGHPYTDDGAWKTPEPVGDYSKWWWMDMLHYRKTGDFATSLAANATDSTTDSYANGYLSHVAGDICGHPFINAIVGGPFRNHAYRHIVLESLADTWLWDHQGKGDILNSNLHEQIALERADFDRVSKLIVSSMRATYSDPMLPNLLPGRYPSWTEIRGAYQRMSLYLELSTSGGVDRPVPPPDDPGDLLDEITELLSRNIPGSPPSYGSGNFLDYLKALFGYLLKGVVFLAMLATLPAAVMNRFLAIGARWLLYLIHLAIFMVASGLRTLLALMGWGYAGIEDFRNFGFLEELITVGGHSLESYPYSSTSIPKPPFYWLSPPQYMANLEHPMTKVGPIPYGGKPSWIIDPSNAIDSESEISDLIAATRPAETDNIVKTIISERRRGFGNAVDFLIRLKEGTIPICNFDLDGDRGYAYKPWQELPPNPTEEYQ